MTIAETSKSAQSLLLWHSFPAFIRKNCFHWCSCIKVLCNTQVFLDLTVTHAGSLISLNVKPWLHVSFVQQNQVWPFRKWAPKLSCGLWQWDVQSGSLVSWGFCGRGFYHPSSSGSCFWCFLTLWKEKSGEFSVQVRAS